MELVHAMAAGDAAKARQLLAVSPELVTVRAEIGATRGTHDAFFLKPIGHYLYGGDSALHIAAAAYRPEIVRTLIGMGADVSAKNRHGAQPLHYAADGAPGSRSWRPAAQAATIAILIGAGADPNATTKNGVAPLHRAVRTRCAAAVKALLDGGAEPDKGNGRGSTAMDLASRTTGRGGSGSSEARAQQREIVRLLVQRTVN